MEQCKLTLEVGKKSYQMELDLPEALEILANLAGLQSSEEEEQPAPARPAKAPKPGKTQKKKGDRICGNCGQPGHRKDKCPNDDSRIPEARVPLGDPLSEDEYRSVQECRADGMLASDVATDLSLSIIEVNSAWAAPTYQSYLELRNR